jgi:hypothetical protein
MLIVIDVRSITGAVFFEDILNLIQKYAQGSILGLS